MMFKREKSINGQFGGASLKASLMIILGLLLTGGWAYAAPPDTMPVWRAQVRFETCTVSDSGSDDYVNVQLNSANRTWLESDVDDFASYVPHTYDLRLEGVNRLSDIDFLRIEKTGTDGWCIKKMYLIINGATIFYRDFGSGLWLDNSGGHSRVYFLDDSFMRVRAEWINYVQPVRPNVIRASEMRYRVEAILGDFVAQDHLSGELSGLMMARFGSSGTELFTLNNSTWRYDLDMEADGVLFNMDIDVDFDLRVGCSNGRLTFSTANVSASSTYNWQATDRARGFAVRLLAPRLNEMMKNFTFGSCAFITLTISPYGDLNINSVFGPIDGGVILNGGVISSGLANQEAETPQPVSLNILSDKNIQPNQETFITATVTSGLTEEANAEISFELPAQSVLLTPVVEIEDTDGKRAIPVQDSVRQNDGTTLVKFRDRLPAGQNAEYTIRLMFQTTEEKTEQVVTSVQVLDPKSSDVKAKIQAATSFDFKSSVIKLKGTSIKNSPINKPENK